MSTVKGPAVTLILTAAHTWRLLGTYDAGIAILGDLRGSQLSYDCSDKSMLSILHQAVVPCCL